MPHNSVNPTTHARARGRSSRLWLLLGVGGVALAGAGWLYQKSLNWVPEAEKRAKEAQLKAATEATPPPSIGTAPPLNAGDPPIKQAHVLAEQGHFMAALPLAERAVQLEPQSPDAHLLLAMVYTTLDYRQDAVAQYKAALALDPSMLETYQHYGDLQLAMGAPQDAERTFKQAMDKQPALSGPRTSLAGLYLGQNRLARALDVLEPVLKSEKPPTPALFIAGKACQGLSKSQRGIEILRRAVALDPNYADAHHVLGSMLANEGNYKEGIPELEQAVKLAPDNPTYQYALGNAYRSDRSLPEAAAKARAAFEKALEINPAFPTAHYYYGLTLEDSGEMEAALREYRRTLELDPKYLSAGYRIGVVYKTLGKDKEAKSYLEKFGRDAKLEINHVHDARRVNSFVDTTESQVQRGMEFLKKGDRTRAAAAFRAAIQRDPTNGIARRELRGLGEAAP
jgi:tetratricopeptide (TPR) repeat protein